MFIMSKSNHSISGVLNINKPKGITSHDVVEQIRRLINQPKVGHAGTLDPFATGVLLILIGSATRLGEYVLPLPKTYTAEFTLGATSNTDDITGIVDDTANPPVPTRKEVSSMLRTFVGEQHQVPPAYAAVKIKGKKLYEYARAGEPVLASPRTVRIHEITLLTYTYPRLQVEAIVSSGTYIRALARDIGEVLKTGAYVSTLQRTAIGQFDIKHSILLKNLTPQDLLTHLVPPQELISHLPAIMLNQANVAKLQQGIAIPWLEHLPPGQPVRLMNEKNSLVGIGSCTSAPTFLRAIKILNP